MDGLFLPDRLQRLLKPESLSVLLATTAIVATFAILIRLRRTYDLDLRVTRNIQKLEHPLLTRLAHGATWLGNSLTIVLICAGLVAVAVQGHQGAAAVLMIASLAAMPINVVVKNLVDRERPGESEAKLHGGPRWGFSYPSGHSMASAAFYGFLAFLFYVLLPDPGWRYGLSAFFGLLPVVVGLSRIYLGAHWLSDVVGGWAGGLFVAVPLALLYPA